VTPRISILGRILLLDNAILAAYQVAVGIGDFDKLAVAGSTFI
jgi:hypothetical protein